MKNKRWLRYLPAGLSALAILLVAVGVYVFRDFFQAPVTGKKQVQQVTVMQPPPPPPPPPEVKPPEPEVKEEKIEEPEPEPEPEPQPEPDSSEPPPGEDLGVDAEGGAGGDSFGLVGKKGGRGLVGSGNGAGTGRIGGGGNAFIYYGQQVGQSIQDELHRNLKDKARSSSYSAVVHLWINPDGSVGRVELANSSGTAEIDEALKVALRGIHDRFKPPPEKMPQPLKIRIRS
jgi:protein TonB